MLKALGGLALVGTGAGIYRAGEAIHPRTSPHALNAATAAPSTIPRTSTTPQYLKYGNMQVNSLVADQFEKAAVVMRQYPGTNKTLSFLLNAPPYYKSFMTLKIERGDLYAGSVSEYEPASNSIYWNDFEKLTVINPKNTTDIAGISPVGVLAHQMKHAEHYLTDPVAAYVRAGIPHPLFDNHEEKLTTLETNRDLADLPGEAQRLDNHNVGQPGDARNVTDNTVDPAFKGLDEVMIDQSRATYSKESYYLASDLAALRSTSADTLDTAQGLKQIFAGSFNNTNILKIKDLMDEGTALSINYATANHNNTEPAALANELTEFSRKAESFAANLYAGSGDKQLGQFDYLSNPNAIRDQAALNNAISNHGDPGSSTLTPIDEVSQLQESAAAPAPYSSMSLPPLAQNSADAVGAKPAP